jgi:hypothetical protein
MWSGWVGDQDPTFAGLQDAMINMLESAWQNYTNFGSDTGGYRSGAPTGELLLRWASVNAFMPLFENGGNNNHTPWYYDAPGSTALTDAYRSLVAAHYELNPYLLTTGAQSYEAGISSIRPNSKPPVDFPFALEPDFVSDWSYKLGADVYHSPVLSSNVSAINVTMPTDGNSTWYEYWNPSKTHAPGSSFVYACPLSAPPVFVRAGSVIPLHVSTPLALVPFGDDAWASALTLALHTPRVGERMAFEMRDFQSGGLAAEYFYTQHGAADAAGAGELEFTISAYADRPVVLVLRGVTLSSDAAVAIRGGAGTGTHAAARRPSPARLDPSVAKPAPLAWDTTAPGARYPPAGLRERLDAAAPRLLAGAPWWSAESGDAAADASAGVPDPVVIVAIGDVSRGAIVTLSGVVVQA